MNGNSKRFDDPWRRAAGRDAAASTSSAAAEGGAIWTLVAACALTAALWFVPYASAALFPLRLLVTFFHEGGHALAALLTGGSVAGIGINPDGSGVTLSAGGLRLAILPAGYLGATAYGTLLLVLLRRGWSGRRVLVLTGALIGALTLAFIRPWNSLFGFVSGVLLAGALVAASRFLGARPRRGRRRLLPCSAR
jgi:hypothetical protein